MSLTSGVQGGNLACKTLQLYTLNVLTLLAFCKSHTSNALGTCAGDYSITANGQARAEHKLASTFDDIRSNSSLTDKTSHTLKHTRSVIVY